MPIRVFTGHQQPDSALVTTNGVVYRCFSWIDVRRNAVMASIYVEQEHGQRVLLADYVVRRVTAEDEVPDSPKLCVLTSLAGNFFVLHWIEGVRGDNGTLQRAWFEPGSSTSTQTWTIASSPPTISDEWLYDVQNPADSTASFLLTYRATTLSITIRRQQVLTWTTNIFSVSHSRTGANRVLGIYGHVADNDVVISYERGGADGQDHELWSYRVNASNGAGGVEAQTFVELPLCYFFQVTHARYAANRVNVVVECHPFEEPPFANSGVVIVACVRLNSANVAQATNEHWTHNLRLLSRAWSYAGQRQGGSEPRCFAVLGFSNIGPGPAEQDDEFVQRVAFVCDMDASQWSADTQTVRPRPCVNLNLGNVDVRKSGDSPAASIPSGFSVGTRRVNHLSNASGATPWGPSLKARTVALMTFGRVIKIAGDGVLIDPILPVAATVQAYDVLMEEPWTMFRDDTDPDQPEANFRGAYPWTGTEHVQSGRHMVISGGTPALYDGKAIVECGFPWTPEIQRADVDAMDGTIEAGTRSYVVTYAWRDDLGSLHRSSPSAPVVVEVDANNSVDLDVTTLTISHRDNALHYPLSAPIEVEIWRTLANSTVYYRLFGAVEGTYRVSATPINDPTTWRIEVLDDLNDATLQGHEILPFTLVNGFWTPLEPIQPPASTAIAKWRNRVWLASAEDERALWYSQELLPEPGGVNTMPPEFNPANVFRIDEVGLLVAMAAMDASLILLGRDGVHRLTGEPNTAAGSGATLQLETIVTGIGCIEPRSVVLGTDGLFFQSSKGIYVLSWQMQLTLVAAPEDDVRASGNLRGGTLLEGEQQIRWIGNDAVDGAPTVLCYDTHHREWSKFLMPLADEPGGLGWLCATAGGCSWRGADGQALHVVLEQGALLIERSTNDAAPYADENRTGNIAIPMRVRTGWIGIGGLAGYVRLWEFGIQADKPHASAMACSYEWDIRGTYSETPEAITWASPAPPYMPARPAVQKVTAFRLTIFEDGVVPATENVALVGLVLRYGRHKGARRVPDSQFGA